MNKDRRKRLEALSDKLAEVIHEISCIKDEENEAYDNLPESLQDGEKGSTMSENVDELETIESDLESSLDSINELINK